MNEILIYGTLLIGLFLVLFYWFLNSISINSLLTKLKEKNQNTFKPKKPRILNEDDLKSFPRLMQEYLKKIGAVGKEIPHNFSLSFKGNFRIDKQKPSMPINAVQFNYLPEPTRLFTMKLYMFKIVTMVGVHEHHQGKGSFGGKLLRYITLFNIQGKEIDIGDLTTFLNDCVLLSPAGLVYLQDKLEWKELNESTLSVTLTYKDLSVQATLFFNQEGLLSDFSTTDRFYEEQQTDGSKIWIQGEWRTPIIEYEKINDSLRIKRAKALWKLPDEDFEYADFTVKSINYNVSI